MPRPRQQIDVVGKRYGRWHVMGFAKWEGRVRYWDCVCVCGTKRAVSYSNLQTGSSKSCGCLTKENAFKVNATVNGLSVHPLYGTWNMMHFRCYNKNSPDYKNYGGRGIKVCHRWHTFANFLEDVGERPPGKSIDRYPNNDGNYGPTNFRWATAKQQAQNKRKCTLAGVSHADGRRRSAMDV